MVERELPKLVMRVRFPSPAPIKKTAPAAVFFIGNSITRSETAGAGSTTSERRAKERRLPKAMSARATEFFIKTKVIPVACSNKQKCTLAVRFFY